uniref:Exopolysaccharide biosynthesis protein n=1 Tax=Desulfobacca acetoxidans TaxID=60893 RepID=A0A7V6A3E1_9BACT
MGFIDKALEKAKAEKQKTQGNPANTAPAIPTTAPAEMAPPPAGSDLPFGDIRYSITRTVAVQPEVLRRHRIITSSDDSQVREEYKILRTHILQKTLTEQKNTLMITGPLPGEGKTLTAINLAISLSHEVHKTVLLVDADMRSPSVHNYFGFPQGKGLVDYLAGEATLPDLLVHPEGFDKLVILPGGRPVMGASELIGSPMMGNLVRELKHFYPDRYVLFDLPPVLSYADPLAFAPFVDGIILVVQMGKTSRDDIEKCVQVFKNFPVLGTVLNKIDKRDHEGYYYFAHKEKEPNWQKRFLGWVKS